MSLLRKISLAFLVVILLFIGTITVLLTTNAGVRFTINSVVSFVPGLEIGQIKGNLSDLSLSDIKFDMAGIHIKADELLLAVNFSCLANSKLCVDNLATRNVDIAIDTSLLPDSPVDPNAKPITNVSTPYPIELGNLSLSNTKVVVNGIVISLDHFSSAASWQERLVTLKPTVIDSLLVSLPKSQSGQAAASAETSTQSEPLGKVLSELFSQPLLTSLPQVDLPVDAIVEQISGHNLQLVNNGTTTVVDSLLIVADSQFSDINIETFKIVAPQGTAALVGKISLKQGWPLSLVLNSALNIKELAGEKVKLSLDGNIVGDLNLSVNVSGPVSVQLNAQASLATPELPLSLTVESKKMQWPITGTADYQANNVRLRLTGKATDYQLSLRSDFSGAEIPIANMIFDGKGNTQQFKLALLRLSALQGKTELSGLIDWSKAISWNTLLTFHDINTAKEWPQWPATLQGKLVSKGSIYGGNWQLDLSGINLKGSIKKQALNMSGSLRGNAAGQWRIPNLLLALGNNQIDVKGELAKAWSLDANVNAPNLNEILPGLRGNIKGVVKLRGTPKAPQLLTDITATGLKWQDITIAKIALNGNVIASQQVSGDLQLDLENLVQEQTKIKRILLTAKGNEKSHQLVFNADGRPFSGGLILTGQFDHAKEYWHGQLSKVGFKTPLGDWSLSKELGLDYHNITQKLTIAAHCWLNDNAQLCLSKAAQIGKSGQVAIELKRFDLAILKKLFRGTGLKGVFTGTADFNWLDNGQLPQGKIILNGDGVEITTQVNDRKLPIAFDDIHFDANMSPQTIKLNSLLKLKNNGQFKANIQINDPQNSRQLSGSIQLDKLSLALLKPSLGEKERADGSLNGNLKLIGNAKAPQIVGRLNLEQLMLDTQWSPVTVTAGDIKLEFNGFSSLLTGLIKTQQGELALNGHADWHKIDAWLAKITAKGERIRIDMPPVVQLDISPDITFEATPGLLKLAGIVAIPWAKIIVKEIPESAVGVSSDEVLLDTHLQPVVQQSSPIAIQSELVIKIGPNVSIDAFGLKSSVQGNLKMIQDSKGLGLHGDINLLKGSFRAYGQDLLINKGLIIFAGPPELPQLNIEAIRNPEATEDGVTAGLRITGLADRPQLEVFSDPAMSQEAALSYLLRGQGLTASTDDNSMMTSMLVGLSVAQSGKLVGKIGETFGVSNLTLDTQGVGDSSQVVVSGYVLPGLQLKYGVGIFDSLATLTLRYRVLPRLYLEAVSGLDQALDLLYQFEF